MLMRGEPSIPSGAGPAHPAQPRGQRIREENSRYERAREAYASLLKTGRLRCGQACPLYAVGRCASMCW